MKTNIQQSETILKRLKVAYSNAKIALQYKTPWELLVAVILSAQCTDIMVNKVTEKLFTKYKTLDDYVRADVSSFEQDIRSTGFYHNKAKNILTTAKLLKEKFHGEIPKTMEEMLTLSGVARKTANIVLGNIYHVKSGIPVDTHVHRLSQRLRLVDMTKIGGKREITFTKNGKTIVDYKKDADPEKIELQLMDVVPKNDWLQVSYWIIDHGRAICKAQNPNCNDCPILDLCPVSRI
jgi:endonuclease III